MARRSRKKKETENKTEEHVDVKEMEAQDESENKASHEESAEQASDQPDFQSKYLEMNDKFVRLYSEFENFRKRTAKERLDLMASARGESLSSLLPIVDDFDRAIVNNENTEDIAALKDGFKLIHNKLLNTLTQTGLKEMDTKAGDDFDTDKHEAVTQIPAPSDELKGKVVDVIEKGYVINDKVIRYAKVVIGS
ncbi:MAG: nucleotide exchange factor GrpE [Flavobacteriales bacterium]|nr:nucleotide exchange factor GrpE [Flavobacteriales bacterium]